MVTFCLSCFTVCSLYFNNVLALRIFLFISIVLSLFFFVTFQLFIWASLVAQTIKHLPAMWETWIQSLENEIATQSSTLAWRIPWTEEPGRLQSTGSQRVGHDWALFIYVLDEFCKYISRLNISYVCIEFMYQHCFLVILYHHLRILFYDLPRVYF